MRAQVTCLRGPFEPDKHLNESPQNHQAKKYCQRRLAVNTYQQPDSLQLPTLTPRPPSPKTEPVSTWDDFEDNKRTILDEKPVSEMDLVDQDAYFEDPARSPDDILFAAVNAVRGNSSQFVEWDSEGMRLVSKLVRMQGVSTAATVGVLQECADVGSHVRRLKSVVSQIQIMRPSPVLLALASVILDEIDNVVMHELDSSHILRLLESSLDPAVTAHVLARVVGCADLRIRANLRYLPSTAELLNTAYREMVRVQLEPTKYDLLWRVVGRTLQPWISQLNRMLGIDQAILSVPAEVLASEFLSDMFIRRQGAFFALDESLVPDFVPQSIAQLVVECLNCGMVLKSLTPPIDEIVCWPGNPAKTGRLSIGSWSIVDPFDAQNLENLERPQETVRYDPSPGYQPSISLDPASTIYSILRPIDARHECLNAAATTMLFDPCPGMTLRDHARILTQIFCLQNGKLFASLQDPMDSMMNEVDAVTWELAADAATTALEDAIEDLELAPKCVDFEFCKNRYARGTSFLVAKYIPTSPCDMIVTPGVVHSAISIFHYLLELQNSVKTHSRARNHDRLLLCFGELRDASLEISKFQRHLSAALEGQAPNLANIINAFGGFAELAYRLGARRGISH